MTASLWITLRQLDAAAAAGELDELELELELLPESLELDEPVLDLSDDELDSEVPLLVDPFDELLPDSRLSVR
ncbi:hypothetical protein AU186_07025 [Mycobacterium sp. GA-1999]|nr:hypothetical protein AU187_05045 [Mycobacterium sp. IS-1556]KUH86912.1 hypothetical protein AU185_20310 [Mycobacterium sp. GA-0227b]KUH92189.1 hypothetical protein AU186_07025 [Mycobacterium sp. GA-1999]